MNFFIFLFKESDSLGFKLGENKIILINEKKEDLKVVFPVNNIPENLFRTIFNKNSVSPINHMNFISKNYRFKCENCTNLCGLFFYIDKGEEDFLKSSIIICENCFAKDEKFKEKKEAFKHTTIFNILSDPNEIEIKEKHNTEKWNEKDLLKLIESINSYGDNWDEIIKSFPGKTKQDCITQFLQMPIKENLQFRVTDLTVNDLEKKYICTEEGNKNISIVNNVSNSTTIINKNNYIMNVDSENKLNGHHSDINQSNKVNENEENSGDTNPNKSNPVYTSSSAVNDLSNPLVSQIVFFSKMFQKFVEADQRLMVEKEKEKFNEENKMKNIIYNPPEFSKSHLTKNYSLENIKENIYKTYSKTIDSSKENQIKEKSKMKMVLDLLIHTQLKKIELKLDYFNEFERLMEFELGQMKSLESNLIHDRVRFALKKVELSEQLEKLKQIQNQMREIKTLSNNQQVNNYPPGEEYSSGKKTDAIPLQGSSINFLNANNNSNTNSNSKIKADN